MKWDALIKASDELDKMNSEASAQEEYVFELECDVEEEIKDMFNSISGEEVNGIKWYLGSYIKDIRLLSSDNKIIIDFINKFYMTFDVANQLNELFKDFKLTIMEDNGHLTLVMDGD